MIAEPDVALTDYGLVVECGVFSWCLDRTSPAGRWFATFFGATAAAALVGGTVHGFFPDADALASRLLWQATLLGIGMTALAGWAAGAHLLLPGARTRWLVRAALVEFVGYAVLVLSGTQAFRVAVYDYLPAALFLLLGFAFTFARTLERPALLGALGLGLTLIASAVQQGGTALDTRWLDHNAIYHVIQGVALALVFVGARAVARRTAC